jgi:hypothetical protein
MAVLSHSSLPLTSNLKQFRLDEVGKLSLSGGDGDSNFRKIIQLLIDAVRNGIGVTKTIWDYDYASLWSPRLTTLCKDGVLRKINVWSCKPETLLGLLLTRTYWYKRLPKSGQNKVKRLVMTRQGRHRLKDVLDTCDGVLTSLVFGFPEMFLEEGYKLSDRIINSVMMQCFHNYSLFQKEFKQMRKTIRHAKLNKIEIDLNNDYLRRYSWMVRPIQILNRMKDRTSKSIMFRIAMLCQTRATGLAGHRQMEESVSEFLELVTKPREFTPNPLMIRCIEAITDDFSQLNNLGKNPEFKISMSTSACTESNVAHEGKFGYMKKLVRAAALEIPPLSEGIPGTLGNHFWSMSHSVLRDWKDKAMKVNVCAIRENGKARVVTSGSFWKDVALQPFSHVTIHLARTNKILRDGLKAGRLGWRRMEKIESTREDYDDTNWIFDTKGVRSYSSDWSKATDKPTPEMAWALTGRLLEKCGLDAKTLSMVKEYWLGPKQLFYRGRPVGTLLNGVPMGDPLTKTNLSLAHPVCHLYATVKTSQKSHYVGNGDDVHAFIEGPEWAEAHQEAAQMLGYDISTLDTAVTEDWGTYCEEWFCKPPARITSCKWGTRFKNSNLLPYLDVPKIRTMIATEKDRRDFSSDPAGKVTLLGHDQEYFKSTDPGPLQTIYAIASAFQDITLATVDQKKPLFLPRQVNGIGKPVPFWSTENWMNLFQHCPEWHVKYYLTVMDEYVNGRSGLSSYRGTLKESFHFSDEMMVELYQIPENEPIRRYIVIAHDQWDEWEHGILTKLISTGYLIPESKIAKYYLMQQRLMTLEQDLPQQDLFEVIKAKMVKYPDITNASQIVRNFVRNYRDSSYRLKQDRRENLYPIEAVRVLERGNPLTVTVSDFPLIKKFGKYEIPTNLYELRAQELYQWFMKEYTRRHRGEKRVPPPTDIIEDDPIIIQTIGEGGADIFIIVTDDVRLFKLATNKFPDTFIFRMSTLHYLQTNTWIAENGGDWDEEVDLAFSKEFDGLTIETLIDKGSVESYLHKYHVHQEGVYFQVEGIPWNKDMSPRNISKKPYHGFAVMPEKISFDELRFPRSVIPEGEYRYLKRRYGIRGLALS